MHLYVLAGILQAQPSVRITSPLNGAIARPGELLQVTVEVSPPTAFEIVALDTATPLNKGTQVLKTPPYHFTIQIPSNIRPDKYSFVAAGVTFSKKFIYSKPIEIAIERADLPISISVYPKVADFTMDQKRYLQVTGTYADKTTADITQSSRTKYVSNAPDVALVNSQGIVTPVAPGMGKITITFGSLKLEVPVSVRRTRR